MIEPKLVSDAQIAEWTSAADRGGLWRNVDVIRLLGHIVAQAYAITAVATALTASGLGAGTDQLAERVSMLASGRDYVSARVPEYAKELVELRANFASVSERATELLLQVARLEERLAAATADKGVPS